MDDSKSGYGAGPAWRACGAPPRAPGAQRKGEQGLAPCRAAIEAAERRNALAGHENEGFLSSSHGFIPRAEPLRALDREFAAWDELAAELPALHRDLSLRRRVRELPLLDASAASLDDRQALRACALLAILAHAYWYVEPRPPEQLPEVIRRPWAQLRQRLGRAQEVLSYIDLIVYNWRLDDPARPEPMVVENLSLLLPTIDNREERVFYLTQVEILARATPIVRLAALAQEAVLRDDPQGLEQVLLEIGGCLDRIVRISLPKISPSPLGATHVDPVVWAKTVAPFAVPMRAGDQGPSGTSSPIFNALDLFFGRKHRRSFLGREIEQLRAAYPPAWRAFLDALGQVPIDAYVQRSGSKPLEGAWREAFATYAGEHGFLGRHRMKVYGYLELAFKVGRSLTIGGFGGAFQDRTWDEVDAELRASRGERQSELPTGCSHARVQASAAPPEAAVRRVTLDIAGAGERPRAGDRCAVHPENGPELIGRTLAALGARGDERVRLTDEWVSALRDRPGLGGVSELALGDVLRFGSLRPVRPRVAEALHARSQSRALLKALREGCTERWELWELLELLRAEGVDPAQLWREPGGEVGDRPCRLIPPEQPRLYSIASTGPAAPHEPPAATLELAVAPLRHAPAPGGRLDGAGLGCPVRHPANAAARRGAASSFLERAGRERCPVAIEIERPATFRLPEDPRTPIVFFAGGSGIAPFRGFLAERRRTVGSGPLWLLWSLRSAEDFAWLEPELLEAVRAGALRLDVCFTREAVELARDPGAGPWLVPGASRRVRDLIVDERAAPALGELLAPTSPAERAGHAYICGSGGFARSVLDALEVVAGGSCSAQRPSRSTALERLAADRRLALEVHTDRAPESQPARWIDASELAQHRTPEAGYWLAIERDVYDLTRFSQLHPGGLRVVQAYAGMDATHGYARAHERRPEVDAMRDMYRIGRLRTLDLEDEVIDVASPAGVRPASCRTAHAAWVRALYLVVEMQNALDADHSLAGRARGEAEAHLYELSRAAETHQRFVESYQRVLEQETLPSLWRITQALFAPDADVDWMEAGLRELRASPAARDAQALASDLLASFAAHSAHPARLARRLDALREADARLLAELAGALRDGVRVFERHERRTRHAGAPAIRRACEALLQAFRTTIRDLARSLSAPASDPPPPDTAAPASPPQALYVSRHLTLHVDAARRVVVMGRSPRPWRTPAHARAEAEALLLALPTSPGELGLLVDLREAPLRNEPELEAATAELRRALTTSFARTAVLIDGALAELQVTRLARDEKHCLLATRSEAAALSYLRGGK